MSSKKSLNSKYGFTLIEVAIVLGLIALIAMLVGANKTCLNRIIVRSEIDKLYSLCRYLQSCAIVNNKQEELIFDIASRTYRYHNRKYILANQVYFGFISGVKGPPSAPTSLIEKPVTFTENRVIFYPDGVIKSGTMYLVDSGKQYMYALSSPISQVSYLRKYQYNGKWHLLS